MDIFVNLKNGLKSIDMENNFHPTYKISPSKNEICPIIENGSFFGDRSYISCR